MTKKKDPKDNQKKEQKSTTVTLPLGRGAIIVGPFLLAMAPNVPPAIAQVATPVVKALTQSSGQRFEISGPDGFVLSKAWADREQVREAAQRGKRHAESVALLTLVVDAALRRSDRRPLPGLHKALVQWIFAGGMEPKDAEEVRRGGTPESFHRLEDQIAQMTALKAWEQGAQAQEELMDDGSVFVITEAEAHALRQLPGTPETTNR